MKGKKIIDEYTNLPLSRQAKYVLRNRERVREIERRHRQTEKYKLRNRHRYHKRLFDDCSLCYN